MSTTNPNDPPDPDEDNPAFLKYLEKNLPWLTEKLKIPSGSSNGPPSADPIAAFLKEALTETKAEMRKMADQLEAVRDILTPEQLTQLKLLKKEGGAGPGNPPTPGNPPSDPPPPKPPTPEKKRSKWL